MIHFDMRAPAKESLARWDAYRNSAAFHERSPAMTLSTYELLRRVESRVIALTQIMVADMANVQTEINNLRKSVEKSGSVVDGVLELVRGMSEAMRENADDAEEIKALADAIDAKANALAAAVSANTAAEDEEPAEPAPDAPSEPSEPAP